MARDPTRLEDFEAVEMAADYEYNINNVAAIFRDGFPQEFVSTEHGSEGITKLSKGEQGWRIQASPNGQQSMCLFPRGPSHLPSFLIPTSFLQIGAKMNARVEYTFQVTSIPNGASRPWLRRSLPATPYQPRMHRYTTAFVLPSIQQTEGQSFGTAKFWLAPNLDIEINKHTISGGNLRPDMLCNMVIEVTADKKPHPKPFVKLPSIGLYENFGEASSMATYIESHDHSTGKWYRTQIFHQQPLDHVSTSNVYTPRPYIQVKKILQLLERTQWATTNEHFTDQQFSVESMKHVVYDHLGQTFQFLDVPSVTIPLPR
ncbi:hypothetical protein KJ359_003464 [Pestalotiopsis sp. 9143b]|nr:hypothetical protein KJ359_003464 [Pestalotiopsis sp. 9143b]